MSFKSFKLFPLRSAAASRDKPHAELGTTEVPRSEGGAPPQDPTAGLSVALRWSQGGVAHRQRLLSQLLLEYHFETLTIYELSYKKFTTRNDLHQ